MSDNVNHPDHYTSSDPEFLSVVRHLLPGERRIVECLVGSVSKSGEAAKEEFRKAVRQARRIACDEEGRYDPGAVDVAIGHILGVIAAFAPSGPGLWRDVFDAAYRISGE
jgi:hypothetical protein|nr:MAG TPA: protein of unknown function DUF3310 [Caudoviricetes sp.]